ncbi:hypothetical protein DL98DRAFT_92117 [Cadophora sp. DSE1049]|nr:hypothetical protein DL98DRAFT_92117 [Cadophora sp. DSE1049]
MKPFWGLATYVLETLLMKARGQDENDMDLHFTYGDVKVENRELKGTILSLSHSNPFSTAMKDPHARPMENWHTDITKSLGVIFEKYLKDADRALKASNKKPKGQQGPRNLTLIVLTDGIWAGTKDLVEVKTLIVEFVQKVEELVGHSLAERQVSIEFVQFGDDVDASHRLDILDNDLVFDGIPDIVDTEHSLGDAIKMLLGSFNDQFDEKEDDEENNIRWPSHSLQSFDTFNTVPRRDSTLYRSESSASQATQRRSIHSPASPTPSCIATGTTDRQSLSSPPLPLRQQSSPRGPPHQEDQYRS